jgi:hypothetical protein
MNKTIKLQQKLLGKRTPYPDKQSVPNGQIEELPLNK